MMAIITLTKDRLDLVQNCFYYLSSFCIGYPWRWYVVDNGKDGTGQWLRDLARGNSDLHDKIVVLNHDNSGNFSSMNNLAAGFALARGKEPFLLFLNNDVEILSDVVTNSALFLEENPEAGAVGACLRYPDGRLQHGGVAFDYDALPGNVGFQMAQRRGLTLVPHPEAGTEPVEWQAVTAACLAMRTADFHGVGGFHEEFSWAFDDVDLCLRLRHLIGRRNYVLPWNRGVHHESLSGGDRYVGENLQLFISRWKGLTVKDMP